MHDLPVDVHATTEAIEALAEAHPDKVRLTQLAATASGPLYRVDVLPLEASGRSARRKGQKGRRPRKPPAPLKVLLSAGVHGNEPTSVGVVMAWLRRLVGSRRLRRRFAITALPMVNPTGLAALTRENAAGIDLNRSFRLGRYTRETLAIVHAVRRERWDLFIDLHGAYRDGFFLIRARNDGPLSGRILSVMPKSALLSPGRPKLGPYALHTHGGATSNNPGTFKGFMAQRVRYAYTLEYSRRLPSDRQRAGLLRLLDSTLHQVYRHASDRTANSRVHGRSAGQDR